jgi:integrase/recombinase XerD
MAVAGWKTREMVDRYTRSTAADRAATEARGPSTSATSDV